MVWLAKKKKTNLKPFYFTLGHYLNYDFYPQVLMFFELAFGFGDVDMIDYGSIVRACYSIEYNAFCQPLKKTFVNCIVAFMPLFCSAICNKCLKEVIPFSFQL